MSTREANYESVYRILEMMRLLDRTPNRSMTVSSLATRLDISEKTVGRYAKALSETYDPRLGGPLLALQGKGRDRAVRLARDLLDHEERNVFRFAAVRAATRLLARANGSILGDSSEGAVEVFRGTLSPQSRSFVERAEKALCYVPFIPKDLRETDDVIDTLLTAIIHRYVVEVDRHSLWAGKDKRERLEPYSLVVYRDGLYLLARVPSRRTISAERAFVPVPAPSSHSRLP